MTKENGNKIKLVDGVTVTPGVSDGVIKINHAGKTVMLTSIVLRLLVLNSDGKQLFDINKQLLNKYNTGMY